MGSLLGTIGSIFGGGSNAASGSSLASPNENNLNFSGPTISIGKPGDPNWGMIGIAAALGVVALVLITRK